MSTAESKLQHSEEIGYNWIPIVGQPLTKDHSSLVFHGGVRSLEESDGREQARPGEVSKMTNMGLYVSDQVFTGGSITARVQFEGEPQDVSVFEIVLIYDPVTQYQLNIGIPGNAFPLFSLREWQGSAQQRWHEYAGAGDRRTGLVTGSEYILKATVSGSKVSLYANGVEVIHYTLPVSFPQSQVGMFCIHEADILIKEYCVQNEKPKAFVVMQFASQYDDVYMEVVKSICEEMSIEVQRIDDSPGPGLIIADISRAIAESNLVIADITPVNANVYYEVGYAHGLAKPTILIAERGTPLPFDISPFRTIFYDNSIGGKSRLESGLRKAFSAILQDRNMRIGNR